MSGDRPSLQGGRLSSFACLSVIDQCRLVAGSWPKQANVVNRAAQSANVMDSGSDGGRHLFVLRVVLNVELS